MPVLLEHRIVRHFGYRRAGARCERVEPLLTWRCVVRRIAEGEHLDGAAMIREEYRGIRPAPGYPACPDHEVKAPLFALLQAADIGMSVTENYAMLPAAAVSGFYFAHPDATYFAVGPIGDDQKADLLARKRAAAR